MKLHILFLLASTVQSQDTLKGFRFKDNKSKYRWEDGENGIPQFNSDSFLPPSITMCSRGRILYNRHGDYNFWYRVVIKKRKPSTNSVSDEEVMSLYHRSKGEWSVGGLVMNKEDQDKSEEVRSWPSRNSLRKWTHLCVVGDFTNDKTTLFLNGKKINETEFKFSEKFPEGYFSEEHRLSGDILPGFSVEFGRHNFDWAPIIGEYMDINAWDRSLDEEEMEAITNCRSFELRVGNLFNMSSPFNVTGPLCQQVELEVKELICEDKDILLPVRANTLSAAVKQCNRLLEKSIGPFFRTADKYASLYKRLESLNKTEGFKDLCWFGGRVLVWLPYKKFSGKTTWNHITDGSDVVWDTNLYTGDKPSAEIEGEDSCLWWYPGPLAAEGQHGFPWDCDKKNVFEWSPCVACSVPHTLGKLSKFCNSQLCTKTTKPNLNYKTGFFHSLPEIFN